MSIWSHAKIAFVANQNLNVSEIEDLVGHIYSYSDMDYYLEPKCNLLPMGSEGSLDIVVTKTTKHYTYFSVVGSLRGVDSSCIVKWFDSITSYNEYTGWPDPIIYKAKGFISSDLDGEISIDYKYSKLIYEHLSTVKFRFISFFSDAYYRYCLKTTELYEMKGE